MSALDHLKKLTKVVADTGDYQQLAEFQPEDATTNPSLILQAVQQPGHEQLVQAAVEAAKKRCGNNDDRERLLDEACDQLLLAYGCKILEIIPGLVSIEVDAALSFDTEGSIARARHLIQLFESNDIPRKRILIKLAATWEGCEAAKVLEAEGIACNLTLMFSLTQAIAAAEAGAHLISPFVGRILDWHKKAAGVCAYAPADDPGVKSVKSIYSYYKKHGYKTIVMGASFRNVEEILELAGCDNLTISPKFLKELQELPYDAVSQKLCSTATTADVPEMMTLSEARFRWDMNQDQMATEKLSEGIRSFATDWVKLRTLLSTNYLASVC